MPGAELRSRSIAEGYRYGNVGAKHERNWEVDVEFSFLVRTVAPGATTLLRSLTALQYLLGEGSGGTLHLLHVQVGEQPRLPPVPRRFPVLRDRPNLVVVVVVVW